MFLYDAKFKNLVHTIYMNVKSIDFNIDETIILHDSSQHFWLWLVYNQKPAVCIEYTVQNR